ncbi:MAG: spore coat associated protein CotJA [Lachnospiraceae bacterium]|nr:spore coat associated protein CotJA [Lachnospiraceae bacterium]
MKDYMYKESLGDFPLAMAYVPMQQFDGICDNLEEALSDGTIFPELNKPFKGRRSCKK